MEKKNTKKLQSQTIEVRPSSATIWSNCTRSVTFSRQLEADGLIKPKPVTKALEEGIRAHEVLYKTLVEVLTTRNFGIDYIANKISEYDPEGEFEYLLWQVLRVVQKFEQMMENHGEVSFLLEKKLTFNESLKGTPDIILVSEGREAYLADYKNGRVLVPHNTPQYQIYLIALANIYTDINVFSSETLQRGQDEEVPIATYYREDIERLKAHYEEQSRKARTGEGELFAGTHCRYCPCKIFCPEMTKVIKEIEQMDKIMFTSDEELDQRLKQKKTVERYYEELTEYGKERARDGEPIGNWKIETKRGRRTWNKEAKSLLEQHPELKKDSVALVGIGDAEKILKAKGIEKLDSFLDPYVYRTKDTESLVEK